MKPETTQANEQASEILTNETEADQFDPSSMSMDDLQRVVDGEPLGESGDTPAEESETKESEAAESAQAKSTEGKSVEAKATETKAEQEAVTDEQKADAEKKATDPLEQLRQENVHLKKKLGQQGAEMGDLRKARQALDAVLAKLPETNNEERERLNQLAANDPVAFDAEMEAIRQRRASAREMRQNLELQERIEANRASIKQYLPDFEKSIEPIAALMAKDGASPQDVEGFKKHPHVIDPALAFNMNKRVELSAKINFLEAENEKLKTENAALKKKPASLMKKLENASKNQTITAKTGDGTLKEQSESDPNYPGSMSMEELDRAIAGQQV